MEFLVHGATQLDEPGVFLTFEESAQDLVQNVASLGLDLPALTASGKLLIDEIRVVREEILETGEYDLEGLLIRLGQAIEEVGAKRVVLDTVEALFYGFPNPTILRSELARLFRWLKAEGVTAIITAERGDGQLSRHGLEEYVSDCVILLDHRVTDQISTRRLRVVKYRGSLHGTNEYPFLIDAQGILVLPITSVGLQYRVSTERVSTGVERLDTMLGGAGYYRGSTVLISGTAGTGKTSFAAHFVDAAVKRGERALYCAFEESPDQIVRNMRTIGIELQDSLDHELLRIEAVRPAAYGLEIHLAMILRTLDQFQPSVVVVDPIDALRSAGAALDVKAIMMRLADSLKGRGITGLFTTLTSGSQLEETVVQISSLVDTWLLLRDMESSGERNRGIYVLKSRGMGHSNQIREFLLSEQGIELRDVYVGPAGVLTGSARLAQETQENAQRLARRQEIERRERDLERKRAALETKIADLRSAFQAEETELRQLIEQDEDREQRLVNDRVDMARSRHAD